MEGAWWATQLKVLTRLAKLDTISWLTLKVRAWLITRPDLFVCNCKETLSSCETESECSKTKKLGRSRRLMRQGRRQESYKTCKIRTTTKFWLDVVKSKLGSRKRSRIAKTLASEKRKRNSRSCSATGTLGTRRWQLLRKCVGRKKRWNITCMACAKRITIRHSSASSRSVSKKLTVLPNRMILSKRSESMPAKRLTIKHIKWLRKSLNTRRRAWIWSDLKTNCFANCRRPKSRSGPPFNV